MAEGMIAILITKTGNYGYDEFRVVHLTYPPEFIEQNLDNPHTQARFVLRFGRAEVFYDSEDAVVKARALAKFHKLNDKTSIGFLNYDYVDWASFMDYAFADRLINGIKKKVNAKSKR